MALLRYSESECDVESVLGARDAVSVMLALSEAGWRALSEALGEIVNREGSELRTDFPGGWTIFWKIRDGDSRFFVAHPETDQWVATLALSESHLAKIRLRFERSLEDGFAGALSGLETVSKMSNVEVHVRMRSDRP